MSESIRVVVHGALGRVGKEVVNALCHDPETDPVGAVDLRAVEEQLALGELLKVQLEYLEAYFHIVCNKGNYLCSQNHSSDRIYSSYYSHPDPTIIQYSNF